MPKTYPSHIKQQAKTYIVSLNMTPDEVSEIMQPSASTIDRWADDGGWYNLQKLRNGSTLRVGLSALEQINMIFARAKEEERIVNSKEVDQMVKLRKLMEGLNRELGFVSNGIEAMGKFMEFVREEDEKLFKAISPLSIEFTQGLAKEFAED